MLTRLRNPLSGWLALFLLFCLSVVQAQTTFTWTGAANNNWNNAGNWTKVGTSTSTYPGQNAGQNDLAVINSGTPLLNTGIATTSLNQVTVNAPGTLSLTANNSITITGPFSGSGTFIQSNGTLNVTGDVTLTSFTLTGGTFAYTGTGPQAARGVAYFNLTKSGGGTATLDGNASAAGNISLSAGTLALATFNLSGVNLSGAGTVNFGGGTITLTGNNTQTGTVTGSPVNFAYTGGGTQTVRGLTYDNLTFSGAGLKDLAAVTTVAGTLTTSSNIDQSGFALVLQGPVIRTAGGVTAGGNAITYTSNSNQDVLPGTFTTFTKSGAGIASLTGNVVATATSLNAGTLDIGNFTFNASTFTGAGTFTSGSGTLTLTGNNTHSGTFNAGTGTVVYNVNATQTIQGYGATGYYNLTISNGNTKTIANALTVTNIFLYNGNGTVNVGNNAASFHHFNQTNGTITFGTAALSFSGNVHKTGGTYTSGSGLLTLSGTGFIRSNAGITLSTGATTVNGNRTLQGAGAVTLHNSTVNGTLTNRISMIANTALSGPGTFVQDSSASNLDVNFTGAGPSVSTFSVGTAGTVRYMAAGAQTTRSAAYFNLTLATSGTKTISAGTTLGNNLDVSAPSTTASGLSIPGNWTGNAQLTLTAANTLSVGGNYNNSGGLNLAAGSTLNITGNMNISGSTLTMNNATWTVGGNVSCNNGSAINFTGAGNVDIDGGISHSAGSISWGTSTVDIGGTLSGSGNISFSGAGSMTFSGPGGWTSTLGTFTPSTSLVSYSAATGSQTVRATTYRDLSLSGASTKNLGTGAGGAVSGVFTIPSGQTLIWPGSAATLALNGSVTGTGELLGDPAGTLTVGGTGVSTSLGTLYFDTTKAMGTINFNREWNRAIQVRIGSSVRLNAYTFAGPFTVGGVEIADGEVFKLESPTVTPAAVLPANIGRLRYIMLGANSRFVFEPGGTIPAGTNLTFPIGPLPTASPSYDMLEGLGNGTLNAATIGATTLNGTGTNFDDQILVGYNLYLENGSLVGTISAFVSATQITLAAPGALVTVPAGSRFKLIQAYRPVTIIPSAAVSGGSLSIGIRNHAGGGITSGTNVPNVPSNRRTNFIYEVRASGGFPNYGIWTEALLSNDFNATIDDAKYSFFRWNGTFWIKLAADLVGPGGVPSNTQIRRNTVAGIAGVQTYILGQTGGVLPDDPTFSWTGAGGNNNWKQAGNWNVFPAGAGNWPDDIGHNVIIDGSGSGGPVIQSGDSINVRHIFHTARILTIQNNGILNIVGNYSFNAPSLTAAGIGRLIQSGFTITGTNGSQFLTQLNRGSLLYTTEGGFIGAVQSIASNSSLTLAGIGGSTPINIPDSSTYNIIVPTISAGAGNLTSSTGSRVVTGTGFTAALNGRALYLAGNNLIGFVSLVQSSTSLLLVNNALANASNQPYLVSSAIVPNGTAGTNFLSGSKVRYANSNLDQTIAATSYSILDLLDNRINANTDINRYVNCPGQTITIRDRYRGRPHVKVAAALGPIWQFNHNARYSLLVPNNSNTGLGGVWNNFAIAGVPGVYNVRWGNSPSDRIHLDVTCEHGNNWDFPAMEAQIGNRFGDASFIVNASNGRWVFFPGLAMTVHGTFTAVNLTGAPNYAIRLGTNTVNPAVSLTLRGNISGLNFIQNNGSPIHLANITIEGTGSISGDLFTGVSQLRNLTLNRAGAAIGLSGTQNLTLTEKLTVANGTFSRGGSGTLTAGSAAPSGIEVTGGTFDMSGTSNLSLVNTGALTLSAGTVNLANSGSVTIAGNFSQTGGTFSRLNQALTLQGNMAVSGGITQLAGSTVTLTGTNAQQVSGPGFGFRFHNLSLNKTGGSVTVTSGKVMATGTVSLLAGNTANLATTGSGNFTFVSNATGTARLAPVLGGTLTGTNFTVERFVNGGTSGWYFLGTPVENQTLGNWGDDFDITTPLGCAGTITDIQDRNTVFRFAGDAVPVNGANANETNGWRGPATCDVPLGQGFRVFLKPNFFDAGQGTFENTGSLKVGTDTLPLTYNAGGYGGGGWNLVANPFASNIDWDLGGGAWTKTNVNNAIYIWKGAAGQYGSYVAGLGTNGVDNIIPSGQAFFIKAGAGALLSVSENAKTAVSKALYRTNTSDPVVRIRVGGNNTDDEMIIHFREGSTPAFDPDLDASKLRNPAMNLFSWQGDEEYSIQGLPAVVDQTVVPLGLLGATPGAYQFHVSGISTLQEGVEVMIRDLYLNQTQPVGNDGVVPFDVTSDPNSQGTHRFELVFYPSNGVVSVNPAQSARIRIYPNPSRNGILNLEHPNGLTGHIRIHDALGKMVWEKSLTSKESKVQIPHSLAPGVYSVVAGGETVRLVVQ